MDDWIDKLFYIAIIFLVISIPFMIYHQIQRDKWLKEHCYKIGSIASSVNPGISYDGKMTMVFESGKTGYQCDDNQQYWE